MAKLPDVTELGPTPRADAARPVGSYDVSAYAAGAQKFAAGLSALGKGIDQAGEGFGALALDENRWDYAKAHSDFLARKVELDDATTQDKNYAADENGKTLSQRYTKNIGDLRDQSAALISDPRLRERFVNTMAPQVAEGISRADKHARGLENDASVAYVATQGDNLVQKAITTPDDETRRQLIDSHNQLVDGLVAKGAKTQVEAVAMKQAFAHQYATADLLHSIDSGDPAQITGALNRLRAAPGSGDQVTNRILQVEGTGANPRSSAKGAGQFIDSTWLDVVKRNRPELAAGRSDAEILALRADHALGREMTDAYRRENTAYLQSKGIEPTAGAQYLAHFLGPGGAAAVLSANPKMPVEQALAASVGPDKARKFVEANPSILSGQLAGSVAQWANAKMGGVGPGGHDPADMIRPDIREQLIARAQGALHKERTNTIASFHAGVADDVAEANRTGVVAAPKALGDFVGAYGPDAAPLLFKNYQADLQLAADRKKLSTMTPGQMEELLKSYEPKPGEGYAAAVKRLDDLTAAVRTTGSIRLKDTLQDDLAEANRTGVVANPKKLEDFTLALGAEKGADAFESYQSALRTADQARSLPGATPAQMRGAVAGAEPVAGAGYAEGLKHQEVLRKAVADLQKERDDDPAAYGVKYLPAVQESWKGLQDALADRTASPEAQRAMARDYALKQTMEQQRLGIAPDDIRIVPQAYADQISNALAAAADSEDPKARAGLIAQVKHQAAIWGSDWPSVMRQMADKSQPLVRAIAAGADEGAMTRLLSLPKGENPAAILKEQNETRAKDVNTELNNAMAPFRSSLVGRQLDRDYPGYYGLAQKLAALHVRDGQSAGDAAAKAFNELIGNRYEFRDTYRVPKSAGVAPDDVQAGVVAAQLVLRQSGTETGGNPLRIQPAIDDMGLRETNRGDSFSKFARDGRWVTSPDNGGLNLVYDDKFVRTDDGKPLFMSWADLAKRGTTPEARARVQQQLVQTGGAGPLP